MKSQLQQRKKTSAKLKLSKAPSSVSALLNLSEDEKKQVAAWLDLERNAPILQKTDKAIAAKLNVKTADLTLGSGTGLNVPSGGGRLKSAAQVLLSDGDMTDAEIDAILGIDEGLSDDGIVFEDPTFIAAGRFYYLHDVILQNIILDDPTIIQLDDDDLLFEGKYYH